MRGQPLRFCNPPKLPNAIRRITLAVASAVLVTCVVTNQAAAQSIDLLRDTEIERWLHQNEDPILKVAGIDPATVRLYLVNDPTMNAFAAQSPAAGESEDIFVNAGMIMQVKTPN